VIVKDGSVLVGVGGIGELVCVNLTVGGSVRVNSTGGAGAVSLGVKVWDAVGVAVGAGDSNAPNIFGTNNTANKISTTRITMPIIICTLDFFFVPCGGGADGGDDGAAGWCCGATGFITGTGLTLAGITAPQLAQNFAAGRTGFPHFGQGIDDIRSSLWISM